MKKSEIIIVDDNNIFRAGLKAFINMGDIAKVIGEASNGIEFIELLLTMKPDLVLMDIDMPGMNGLEATQKALEIFPDIKIIAFSMYRDQKNYYKMVNLGAKGFLLKSDGINELEKAIKSVTKGERYYSYILLKEVFNNSNLKKISEKIEIENFADLHQRDVYNTYN